MPIYGAEPERDSQLKAATVKERRNPTIPTRNPTPPSPPKASQPLAFAGAAPPSDSQSEEPMRHNPVPMSSNDRLEALPESHEAARTIPSQQWQTGEPNPSDTRCGDSNSDDGSFYFDGHTVGGHQHQDFLSTTSSVVRGVTAFATAVSREINVCGVYVISVPFF
ncbi:Dolichyl-diphosphooligosaccharide--protein glycosyltransferase subunit [Arachis hypogaea]|nr:Dolichyl-diphosphooligosaccharide--protein glycosyltransferase subunit [Arachis hypogaea]